MYSVIKIDMNVLEYRYNVFLAMRLLLAEVLAAVGVFASGDLLFCSVIFCFFVRWGVGLTQIERIYMMLSSGCG